MDIPPDYKALIFRSLPYNVEVVWKPWKCVPIAYSLSIVIPSTDDRDKIKLPIISDNEVTDHISASTKHLEQFQGETSKDAPLAKLKDVIFNGWSQRKQDLELNLQPYWSYRDDISMEHGRLLKDSRIILPEPIDPEMLEIIHQVHQGQEKYLLYVTETPF